jgi:sarcosine oxidase delta subunit
MNKKTIKEQVLEFLRNLPAEKHDRYNEAFDLYRKSPEKDENQERVYNGGFSDMNLDNLLYDLQKLNGISDLERFVPDPIVEEETEDPELLEALTEEHEKFIHDNGVEEFLNRHRNLLSDELISSLEASLAKLKKNSADDAATMVVVHTSAANGDSITDDQDTGASDGPDEEPAPDDNDNGDEVTADLQQPGATNKTETSEEFTASPDADERKKLRDEFPFLDETNCPIELRALMTDKITAYRSYCTNHNKLMAHQNGSAVISDPKELEAVTKSAVEDFDANRAIYDELNYYKSKGKVLGIHPIFKSLTLQREVNSMNKEELTLFADGSKQFLMIRKGMKTKAKGDAVKIAAVDKAVDEHNQKLILVQRKLEELSGE